MTINMIDLILPLLYLIFLTQFCDTIEITPDDTNVDNTNIRDKIELDIY